MSVREKVSSIRSLPIQRSQKIWPTRKWIRRDIHSQRKSEAVLFNRCSSEHKDYSFTKRSLFFIETFIQKKDLVRKKCFSKVYLVKWDKKSAQPSRSIWYQFVCWQFDYRLIQGCTTQIWCRAKKNNFQCLRAKLLCVYLFKGCIYQ